MNIKSDEFDPAVRSPATLSLRLPGAAPFPSRRLPSAYWEARHALLRQRLGARVRQLRLERDVTLRGLAGALGISVQQLVKYENGTNTLAASRLYMVAVALGVGIDALTDGIDPPSHPIWPASAAEATATSRQDLYDGSEQPASAVAAERKPPVPEGRASLQHEAMEDYAQRLPGLGCKIVSMYARGLSAREITGHMPGLYGEEVPADLVSAMANAALGEIATWQARPLEAVYPLVVFDAVRVKIREEGPVRNKVVHIALGIRADGTKEILGLWLERHEAAGFWALVMEDLRDRGVEDILLALVDDAEGLPGAIRAAFPRAAVQPCIMRLLRHSLQFVARGDAKAVAAALKQICQAADPQAGEAALVAFEASPCGLKYAAIGQIWRRAWRDVVAVYAFPAEIRRVLCATTALEALQAKLRSAVRARGHFLNDHAALELLYLVLNRTEKTWTKPTRDWAMAKARFAEMFGARFTRASA